MVGSEEFAT
jgi:respiratory burst oxidase